MSRNLLNLFKNQTTILEDIDWSSVVGAINKKAYFSTTSDKLLTPPRYQEKEIITKNYDELQDVIDFYLDENEKKREITFLGLSSQAIFTPSITKVQKSQEIAPEELNEICLLIEWYQKYKEFLATWRSRYTAPLQNLDFQRISKITQKARLFLGKDAVLNFDSHPALCDDIKKIAGQENIIRNKLKKFIGNERHRNLLSYYEYDIIGYHFVLPIRTSHYKSSLGAIIGHSDSGKTLLVNPKEIRPDNNDLIELQAVIEQKKKVIFQEVISLIKEGLSDILYLSKLVLHFDLICAKACYSIKYNLVRPQLSNDFIIEAEGLFHPLIPNCISNDLYLKDNQKGVLLSGANTGGKTVFLKSLALSGLFLHYGLYLPAHKITLGSIKSLFFLSSNQQDIEKGMSSFGAEINYVLDMIEEVKENGLIIIDEIFKSTAQEDASALTLGLIDYLQKGTNSKVLLSTHNQETKLHVFNHNSLLSAHFRPPVNNDYSLYKIHYGLPGDSCPFDVIAKLNRHSDEANNFQGLAKSYLKGTGNLGEKIKTLNNQISTYQELTNEAEVLKKQYQQQKLDFENELNFIKGNELEKHQKKIQGLFSNLDELIQKVQNKKDRVELTNHLLEIKSAHRHEKEKVQNKEISSTKVQDLKSPKKLLIGSQYFSKFLNSDVNLKKINEKKNTVIVTKGILTIEHNQNLLFTSKNKKQEKIFSHSINLKEKEQESFQYDCRGMRKDEIYKILEDIIDKLLLEIWPFVIIVHGNGPLKDFVRKSINEFKDFQWMQDIPGNDGSSRIELIKK